jgi:hypothetical protein
MGAVDPAKKWGLGISGEATTADDRAVQVLAAAHVKRICKKLGRCSVVDATAMLKLEVAGLERAIELVEKKMRVIQFGAAGMLRAVQPVGKGSNGER